MAIRSLPPLNALRSFEAAARHGSFNQAAEELFVTPSAISHQIKSLEGFLKIKLFRREKRRVWLTSAGEKYLNAIEHALNEIDMATRRLIATPNASAVNLSVAPAFLTRWLVPHIGQFQQLYPDVELRLSAANTRIDFHHSDTDMAIYYGYDDWDDVESYFLRNARLMPVCSPRLMDGEQALKTPADLCDQTLIHVSNRLDEWESMLNKLGINSSSSGKGLTFSSTSLAIGAAIEGLGVALADVDLIVKELKYGELVTPFDIRLDTKKAFHLVYEKNRPLTYGMKSFFDWITGSIQKTTETE
jgi:LysR family glycine cleavage system transcriptional activator